VVAWDAPGYGISPLRQGGLSIEGLADAAARLVDKEGTRFNVVLGHSMGGIVAPAVHAARPDKVHAVVVSATVASFSQKSEADKKTFLAERIEPLKQGRSFRDTAGPVVASMFAPGSNGPMVELVREVALTTPVDTFCAAIEAIVNYDGLDNLRGIGVPTLLMAGECDPNAPPKVMQRMAERIPGSRYVEFPGIGHLMNLETPDDFDQALIEFLREAPPHRVH